MSAVADEGKAARVRAMFARIVPRYDTINTMMTLGLDRRWRRQTVALVEPKDGLALDIATGTGELALEMMRQGARAVVGADFCFEMLEVAAKKGADAGLDSTVSFVGGDATRLPFSDATFDCIVNGFMLRNVADLDGTLVELCRVLKPGGRLACLDLTPPRGPLHRFFGLYIAAWVPLLGILVGRNYSAYRYLYQSLSAHPDADKLAGMLRSAGFGEAGYRLVGFGTVAIHLAHKPASTREQAHASI